MATIVLFVSIQAVILFPFVENVVPSDIPHSENGLTRNEIIKIHFMEGLKSVEIVIFVVPPLYPTEYSLVKTYT